DLKKLRWVSDPIALARDPGIDVFVELIGGASDPARRAVETALASGKSVVTANKALLAKHGVELAALAERKSVALNFEAAVAGGIKVDPTAVYVEGISSIAPEDLSWADELGYRVKLLGVAVDTGKGIEQRVHPTMVPKDTAIAQVMGVTNAVTVDAHAVHAITLVGPGAGGMA